MFETHRGGTVVARTTSFQHVDPNLNRFSYTTEKGKVSIFLLLGYEDKKVQELDDNALDKALKDMGWTRTGSNDMDQFAIYNGIPYRVAKIEGDEVRDIDENGEEEVFERKDIVLVFATPEEALKLLGATLASARNLLRKRRQRNDSNSKKKAPKFGAFFFGLVSS